MWSQEVKKQKNWQPGENKWKKKNILIKET